MNFDAGQTGELFEERLKTFELQQNGFELLREIQLPLDGLDVQLFAESLVSIAHLVYRYEPYNPPESPADKTLQQVFAERHYEPRKNVELDGDIGVPTTGERRAADRSIGGEEHDGKVCLVGTSERPEAADLRRRGK